MLLTGIRSVQERSWQVCSELPHLLNVGSESFSYSYIPVTGTAPQAAKTIISIFMEFGSSLPSMKTITELDMNSVI